MDTATLNNEVTTMLKKYTNQTFNFSFNFGTICKSPNTYPSQTKWTKALLIEVKCEEKDILYPLMARIFSTTTDNKFLGTTLRMIPMITGEYPSHTKQKITHLIAKQEQFLSLIIKPCPYLSKIDYFNTTLNATLREIIMQ